MAELAGNPVAHLTEYELGHLAEHLEASGRAKELHRLLALGTSEQRNAWYEAEEAIGNTAGFLADVGRAWRIAEKAYAPTEEMRAAETFGRQCRYALITASLHSVARSIPAEFMVALAEKDVWGATQAMAYARQIPDSKQRAESLAALAVHLPESAATKSMCEAFEAAREIPDKHWRALTLTTLARRLPDPLKGRALREAVAAAREIRYEDDRSLALVVAIRELAILGHPEEALGFAREIQDEWERARVLVRLAHHLPKPLKLETLAEVLIRGQASSETVALAAAESASHFPRLLRGLVLRVALMAAGDIWSEGDRAHCLVKLAPHLPKRLLRKAVAMARVIEDPWERSRALAGLAPHLREQEKESIL